MHTFDSESSVSETPETFYTTINSRDKAQCIVCGARGIKHVHIVPKLENDTWKHLRAKGFVPRHAKPVRDEPRNGMLLCRNHHLLFDAPAFYIRWVPEARLFVLVNYSEHPDLVPFDGRAVHLFADDPRVPFHGTFLMHEMRVRGRWPFATDRSFSCPLNWQAWIQPHSKGDNSMGNLNDLPLGVNTSSALTCHTTLCESDQQRPSHLGSLSTTCKTITFTDPFSNPIELKALKQSFAEQPNWKAAMAEGESWEERHELNIGL